MRTKRGHSLYHARFISTLGVSHKVKDKVLSEGSNFGGHAEADKKALVGSIIKDGEHKLILDVGSTANARSEFELLSRRSGVSGNGL